MESPNPPGPSTELRVGTFNIRCATSRDGPNAWEHRLEIFTQTVRRFDPDIVAFQEVLPVQQDDLNAAMPDFGSVATHRDDGCRLGEAASIFYRGSRFECAESGTFWLSESPEAIGSLGWGAACVRICTWVRLRDRLANRMVRVFNTHFDHVSESARLNSAKLVGERIARGGDAEPTILAGDFNATEDGGVYATLLRTAAGAGVKLADSYRAAHPMVNPDELSCHDYTGATAGLRIDWLFHGGALRCQTAEIDRTRSPGGKYPSDHYPVWAVLQYA